MPQISIAELRSLREVLADIDANMISIRVKEPATRHLCEDTRRLTAAARDILDGIHGAPHNAP